MTPRLLLRVTGATAQWRGAWSKRDAAIRAAAAAGYSLREIADAADLSHTAIRRVLEREQDR